ncbi:MAG TPA: KTSC domain-containing protein [Xanthobacteraceae bacterium]|jgi:lysyl-tRNA synthetase class 2
MPSSVIRGFEYDPGKRQLQITFVSGRVYAYEGVPPRTYAAFAAAPSKGSFFNHHIRDHYRFREIKRAG